MRYFYHLTRGSSVRSKRLQRVGQAIVLWGGRDRGSLGCWTILCSIESWLWRPRWAIAGWAAWGMGSRIRRGSEGFDCWSVSSIRNEWDLQRLPWGYSLGSWFWMWSLKKISKGPQFLLSISMKNERSNIRLPFKARTDQLCNERYHPKRTVHSSTRNIEDSISL